MRFLGRPGAWSSEALAACRHCCPLFGRQTLQSRVCEALAEVEAVIGRLRRGIDPEAFFIGKSPQEMAARRPTSMAATRHPVLPPAVSDERQVEDSLGELGIEFFAGESSSTSSEASF